MKVLNIVGARPNFMKIAPLIEAFRQRGIPQSLVHTGQHADRQMSALFFEQLGLPAPDLNLGVGRGSHAVQTAEIMRGIAPVFESHRPDLVVVVGDVNSTLACALVAAKMRIPVAHIEAGLRSFDRAMPEEINRVLTDAISDLLFVSEPSGVANLAREGVSPEKIHFVGNVMIDTLLRHRQRALSQPTLRQLGLQADGSDPVPYVAVTLHRPSNVDDPAALAGLLETLASLAERCPVVFPVHPRTRQRLADFGLERLLGTGPGKVLVTEPFGYLDFLCLMSRAALVITDSGGVQEETTVLGVPCLTVRENTERPATVECGTNRLVGTDPRQVLAAALAILDGKVPLARIPELWDGRAAGRIADIIDRFLAACGADLPPRRNLVPLSRAS
jgi:UDP-N-acetylglucosamine 2-epimerase (non-hydrolysing)